MWNESFSIPKLRREPENGEVISPILYWTWPKLIHASKGGPQLSRGGYSLYFGWYGCAAVLTPFLTFWTGLNTIFLGYFVSSTDTKTIFWGTRTTNHCRIRSFWPQFFPSIFLDPIFRPRTPPSLFWPPFWHSGSEWSQPFGGTPFVFDLFGSNFQRPCSGTPPSVFGPGTPCTQYALAYSTHWTPNTYRFNPSGYDIRFFQIRNRTRIFLLVPWLFQSPSHHR